MSRFFNSFRFAWSGIIAAFREQPNLKVHVLIACVVVAAGFYFNVTSAEWAILVICISLVITLELINSAIEYLVDLVTKEHHPLAGKIKDVAAGAVLVTAVGAAVVGVVVFYKYIVHAMIE
jgi:diacylglycerol kinase (ATP)